MKCLSLWVDDGTMGTIGLKVFKAQGRIRASLSSYPVYGDHIRLDNVIVGWITGSISLLIWKDVLILLEGIRLLNSSSL